MQYEQVYILDFILYFILGMCLLSSCDHASWAFRRNRQTPWGGCTDANPKLLLNDT